MIEDSAKAEAWSHWSAPAKINLFLHVTGRRADGYHELETLFRIVDWCDRIAIAPTGDGRIERVGGDPRIAVDHDLAVRAARLLQQACDVRLGARLAVEKRLPMGGGLGGGSSDAATVLVALDRIWRTGLSTAALCEIGARLGADVPVFVLGRDAWATGIGDLLEPMELPPAHYVIIDPGVAVATGPVFQAPELTRNTTPITISGWLRGSRSCNDLEPVVLARFPEVAAALSWLSARAPARMSGSGACIFAEVADAGAAAKIVEDCPAPWRAHAVRATGQSALLSEARAYRTD
jgi:4-diphosphocytidyl-2-C-methyl-D-erythritol kinase